MILHVKLLGVIQGNILHVHLPLEWDKMVHVRVSEKLFPILSYSAVSMQAYAPSMPHYVSIDLYAICWPISKFKITQQLLLLLCLFEPLVETSLVAEFVMKPYKVCKFLTYFHF